MAFVYVFTCAVNVVVVVVVFVVVVRCDVSLVACKWRSRERGIERLRLFTRLHPAGSLRRRSSPLARVTQR